MKYTFRKIFIGVSIGIILMLFKSCEVHAASYRYLYQAQSVVWSADFDICTEQGNDWVCIDGFNLTKSGFSNESLYFQNSDKNILMKSFTLTIEWNTAERPKVYEYGTLTENLESFFRVGSNYANNSTKLKANQFLSYVKIITEDNTECQITDNLGASITNYRYLYPTFKVPGACRGKMLKSIVLTWQSGYNYSGSKDIVNDLVIPSPFNVNDFISQNKNNTYLLYFPKTDIRKFNGSDMNQQLYFSDSSFYGGTYSQQTYTYQQQQYYH